MFTDQPVTPVRLEVFIDLAWEMRTRKFDRNAIKLLLQPPGLPGLSPNSRQAMDILKCAQELELVREDSEGNFRPAWNARKHSTARGIALSALDQLVLSATNVEPWFAKVYAFAISCDDDILPSGKDAGEKWAGAFNHYLHGNLLPDNPFNSTKYTGLRRWMRYVGLGWHDAEDSFVPCPIERIHRKLSDIFGKKQKLTSDEFMKQLAAHCPELDGGDIFAAVHSGKRNVGRKCTRALAAALRDLHDAEVIRLNCPADSRGWGLDLAGKVRNPLQGLHSDIFDSIELFASSSLD